MFINIFIIKQMIEIWGWLSAVLFGISYLPQLIRTYRLKSVDDISVGLWWMCFGAYVSLLIYGICLEKTALIFNAFFGLSCVSVMLIMYYSYNDSRKEEVRKIVRDTLKELKRRNK